MSVVFPTTANDKSHFINRDADNPWIIYNNTNKNRLLTWYAKFQVSTAQTTSTYVVATISPNETENYVLTLPVPVLDENYLATCEWYRYTSATLITDVNALIAHSVSNLDYVYCTVTFKFYDGDDVLLDTQTIDDILIGKKSIDNIVQAIGPVYTGKYYIGDNTHQGDPINVTWNNYYDVPNNNTCYIELCSVSGTFPNYVVITVSDTTSSAVAFNKEQYLFNTNWNALSEGINYCFRIRGSICNADVNYSNIFQITRDPFDSNISSYSRNNDNNIITRVDLFGAMAGEKAVALDEAIVLGQLEGGYGIVIKQRNALGINTNLVEEDQRDRGYRSAFNVVLELDKGDLSQMRPPRAKEGFLTFVNNGEMVAITDNRYLADDLHYGTLCYLDITHQWALGSDDTRQSPHSYQLEIYDLDETTNNLFANVEVLGKTNICWFQTYNNNMIRVYCVIKGGPEYNQPNLEKDHVSATFVSPYRFYYKLLEIIPRSTSQIAGSGYTFDENINLPGISFDGN